MPKIEEVFAGHHYLLNKVFSSKMDKPDQEKKTKNVDKRCNHLTKGVIYTVGVFFGSIITPAFMAYTYSDNPDMWKKNKWYCLADAVLSFFTAPFIFLALAVKYFALAIFGTEANKPKPA